MFSYLAKIVDSSSDCAASLEILASEARASCATANDAYFRLGVVRGLVSRTQIICENKGLMK